MCCPPGGGRERVSPCDHWRSGISTELHWLHHSSVSCSGVGVCGVQPAGSWPGDSSHSPVQTEIRLHVLHNAGAESAVLPVKHTVPLHRAHYSDCWCSVSDGKSLLELRISTDSGAACQTALNVTPPVLTVLQWSPKHSLRQGARLRNLKNNELSERPCKELCWEAVCLLQNRAEHPAHYQQPGFWMLVSAVSLTWWNATG